MPLIVINSSSPAFLIFLMFLNFLRRFDFVTGPIPLISSRKDLFMLSFSFFFALLLQTYETHLLSLEEPDIPLNIYPSQ